jgi:glycosyltransferase involved in cell wall biosynthesis
MPTVSVIVPNYNHARYLRRRIDSILAQAYRDFELILLDDCSTDDSREILASYSGDPKVRIEFNAKNSGSVFKQWNKGVQTARGRYICIAESDDYADAHFLARMVPILEEQPEVTLAHERLRVCGDYKVWTAMALKGRTAYVAEPLNYFRTHLENVRTRTQAGGLDVSEYFHVMLSVLDRVAPSDTLPQVEHAPQFTCTSQGRVREAGGGVERGFA